ncbi:MAG: hypothetical protein MUF87_13945 [Anaerolineae bacterium]|jgi:hypothetical protein|nr:hypothetical protein [Anaerolineae bacterium]
MNNLRKLLLGIIAILIVANGIYWFSSRTTDLTPTVVRSATARPPFPTITMTPSLAITASLTFMPSETITPSATFTTMIPTLPRTRQPQIRPTTPPIVPSQTLVPMDNPDSGGHQTPLPTDSSNNIPDPMPSQTPVPM